ncbi:MAG: PLP-dependent aminotransferase family protein, partial [Myxococcota bacterium]
DPDPSPALREIAGRPDVRQLLRYPPPEGLERHRGAAATWLREQALPVQAEDILLVGGVQHGLFVALSALMRAGDTLLVEALTYPGVLAVARLLGLDVRGVEIDEDGLVPEALERALSETGARTLYCVPTLHNPTTAMLPPDRRAAVVDIIARHHALIIEDEIHRPLVPRPHTSMFALAREHTVLVHGTSKGVAGGLRLGFLAAAPRFHPELRSSIQASAFATSPLGAEVFATWLEDGTLAETVARKREQARRRIRQVHRAFEGVPAISVRADPRGYIAWVRLTDQRDAATVAAEALARGVRVLPRGEFQPEPTVPADAFRLCVGSAEDETQLDGALHVLRTLLIEAPKAIPVF